MHVAYGKLGRVARLSHDQASNIGGDVEVINLLRRLMSLGHTVHLVTRCVGAPPGVFDHYADPSGAFYGLPTLNAEDREAACAGKFTGTPNLRKYTSVLENAPARLRSMIDDWVIWLGEHNGPCWPKMRRDGTALVRPYGSRLNLVEPLIRTIHALEVDPLWLCPDPRNVLRCDNLERERIGNRSILAQYDVDEDRGSRYEYAGLEVLAIDHLPRCETALRELPERSVPFGALVNEGSLDQRALSRRVLVRPWVHDLGGEIIGSWRTSTCEQLGLPQPVAVPVSDVQKTMQRWTSTIALPAHCTGWATAKVWEAFASDTVCFAHPAYDDQNHIYRYVDDPHARWFLRPRTIDDLKKRIDAVHRDRELRLAILATQRDALDRARRSHEGGSSTVLHNLNVCGE